MCCIKKLSGTCATCLRSPHTPLLLVVPAHARQHICLQRPHRRVMLLSKRKRRCCSPALGSIAADSPSLIKMRSLLLGQPQSQLSKKLKACGGTCVGVTLMLVGMLRPDACMETPYC